MRPRFAFAAALVAASCGPGQSVVTLHIVSSPPLAGIDHLTVAADGKSADRPIAVAPGQPFDKDTYSLVFPKDREGSVAIEVQAIDSAGKVLSSGRVTATVKPSTTVEVTINLCSVESGFTGCGDACVRLDSDANHCGACETSCSSQHVAERACVKGKCAGSCETGFGDCNGDMTTDGCEAELAKDAKHCGGCGKACSTSHVTASCEMGQCAGTCEAGYADCDSDRRTNGCERRVDNDVMSCGPGGATPGACGAKCSTNHITPSCEAGACAGACDAEYADCNSDKRLDGCEAHVATDPQNCGLGGAMGLGCGVKCSIDHISMASCTKGICDGACDPGYRDCDSDKLKNGCEIAYETDPMNCGDCSLKCSTNHIANPTCNGGVCNGPCDAGWDDCNGDKLADGCETLVQKNNDPKNCGGCKTVCSNNHIANPTCTQGLCDGACDPGWADCDNDKRKNGCETQLSVDAKNCGKCGNACSGNHMATVTCQSGVCNGQCAAGFGDCNNDKLGDGCEISLLTDAQHCGACPSVCPAAHITTPTCTNGACSGVCESGWLDCDNDKLANGCEVNKDTSAQHCGACGASCSNNHIGTPVCTAGACTGACDAGYLDCDADKRGSGCEVQAATDAKHCGGCNMACSSNHITTPTCAGGQCTGACDASYGDCNGDKRTDGCETFTQTDVNNCGRCGGKCSLNNVLAAQCTAGVCTGSCAMGFADCNNDKLADGCERAVATDPTSCGVGGGVGQGIMAGCGVVCSNNHISVPTCNAGVCGGVCAANWADCNGNKQSDGCETNTFAVNNCGPGGLSAVPGCGCTCSVSNGTPGCGAGTCTIVCNAGFANCDGVVGNTCSNNAGNGCEVMTAGNPNNCGPGGAMNLGCGVVCSANNMATRTCSSGGVCDGTCAASFGDCDNNKQTNGCETSLVANANHCGACGNKCWTCCGSACTNNAIDPRNCGGCGIVCGAGQQCLPPGACGACTRYYGVSPILVRTTSTTSGLAIADFDGDGKTDLATAVQADNTVIVSFSNGPASFSIRINVATGAQPVALAAADLNGDGRIDLVTGNYVDNTVSVLLNQGNRVFAAKVDYPVATGPYRVALGDINGDNRPDIAVACPQTTVSVLVNKGDGTFSAKTDYAPAGGVTPAVAFGDITGDGKTDMLVGSNVGLYLYTGNNNATFSGPTTVVLSGASDVDVADLNGDGKLDVAASLNSGIAVSLNQGNGTLAASVFYSGGAQGRAVAIGDLTGDGAPEVALVSDNSNDFNVFVNKRDGTFLAPTSFATGSSPIDVAIGDLSGDGQADVTTANWTSGHATIHLNNGNGTFDGPADFLTAAGATGLAVADVNADNKPDLISANPNSSNISVLLNQGSRAMAKKVDYTTAATPNAVAVGDVNGDTRPDVVTSNAGGSASVLLNQGNGVFGAKTDYTTGLNPQSVALADLNSDGRLDIVTANFDANTVSILLGAGNGTFGAKTDLATGAKPNRVLAVDVNSDAVPDLLTSNSNGATFSVLMNKVPSPGSFAGKVDYITAGSPFDIGVGDFNADGKLDVAVPCPGSATVTLYFGGANGVFGGRMDLMAATYPWRIAVADLNGDAKPDLAIADGYNYLTALTATVPGSFAFTGINYPLLSSPNILLAADVDGDGKMDLVTQSPVSSRVRVMFNKCN